MAALSVSNRRPGLAAWVVLLLMGFSRQELFFRASMLPAIQELCGGKTWSALILQAVLFGL